MQRREIISAAALPALLLVPAAAQAAATASAAPGAPLDAMLRPYLARYNLPALAAAVVSGGSVVAAGAVGTRRAGADIPVTLHDPFSIGSDAKAMTAPLAAMDIEQGKLDWQTTVGEIFPELAGTITSRAYVCSRATTSRWSW